MLLFIISLNECLTQIINNGTADANTTSTTACESRAASSVAAFFACYEENYGELFDEAGAVNHMFVTADAEQAISWTKKSLSKAKENNYLPVDEGELQRFFDDAGKDSMLAFGFTWIKVNSRKRAMGSVSTVLICLNLRIC